MLWMRVSPQLRLTWPAAEEGEGLGEAAGARFPVIGEYVVTEKIGSGSFATVWKATHRRHGQQVAVKEIHTSHLTRHLRQRMLVEIDILKTIHHPNIVHLHEVVETPYSTFLVLEYCAGGDLAGYLKRHGRVTEAVARKFMWQIGAGLKVLHSSNLIHRDLKPENLLLSADNADAILKIADFGLARNLGPDGFAENVCGSPLYMAPEVLLFQKYDTKADLWSLGTILFELVTGKLPFQGNNHVQLLRSIKNSNGMLIRRAIVADLHPDCIDLCQRLLCFNPVERLFFDDFLSHKFMKGRAPS